MGKDLVLRVFLAGSMLAIGSLVTEAHEILATEITSEIVSENLKKAEVLRNEAKYEMGLNLALDSLHFAEHLGEDALITEALYQISLLYYFLESYEEARAYMEIGLTHARLHKLSSLEADLLNAQGVLEWKQGNLFEATAKLESALGIRKQQGQTISMASIANNLGIISYSLQRYRDAVNYYKQGIQWLGDSENKRMRSSLYSNLAESLIPLGIFDEAESYLLNSLEIEEQANEPHSLAYTYYNLGELRSEKGDSDAAVELYLKALDIQLGIANEWSASLTRLKLAGEFMRMGDSDKALEELNKGFPSVQNMNALTLLRDYTGQYSKLYQVTGNDGLSHYYSELQQWFATRVEARDQTNTGMDLPNPVKPVRVPSPPPEDGLSTVRVATLALLGVLIIILVVENVRLRRQMKRLES